MKVSTRGGIIRGNTIDGLDIFLGIPYAQPPIYERRFKHSVPLTKWEHPIDATSIAPIPPQPYNKLETFFSSHKQTFTQDENCLYLNIWKQHNHKTLKPVIIYFYGGGFINGHGTAELYNPQHLVEQEDVIVITFNYRLGAWGFLDWSYFDSTLDCNNGLSDQVSVLKWVHAFIEDFGGDPNNITLMGQSAGSMSIMALMSIPQLDQYYHKVMLLSGTLRLDSVNTGRLKAQHFEKLMHQHFDYTSIQQLNTDDILTLMSYDELARGKSKGLELIYNPIKTSEMRHRHSMHKPIFVGYTADEGDIYIKNESKKLAPTRFVEVMALNDITLAEKDVQTASQQSSMITQYYFKQPAEHFLQQLSLHSEHTNLWCACFSWHDNKHSKFQSAYHILDVIFWFGSLQILKAHQLIPSTSTEELSRRMRHDVAYFALHGKMPWEPYNQQSTHIHIYQ